LIHHVEGTLVEKGAGRVVVEVGGIGLEILASDGTLRSLPVPGGRARLLTHLAVREDAWTLFGFGSERERQFFRLLLGVQGVGPRLALAVLSGLGVERLRTAVADSDVATLSTVTGVGKKTASRMIVDLRDKIGSTSGEGVPGAARVSAATEPPDDAVDALVALGYSRQHARDAVQGARARGEDLELEELVKLALRKL
jgi:Holliday junction DNA helicase RuvA